MIAKRNLSFVSFLRIFSLILVAYITPVYAVPVDGTPCDDGNEFTIEDMYTGNVCSGTPIDRDGDGYPYNVDCNDNIPSIHPGAIEISNGIDDDCNPATHDPDTIPEFNSIAMPIIAIIGLVLFFKNRKKNEK